MLDSFLLNKLLYSELHQGKHTVGGQKKWFRNCLKATTKTLALILSVGSHLFPTAQPATRSPKKSEQQKPGDSQQQSRSEPNTASPSTLLSHLPYLPKSIKSWDWPFYPSLTRTSNGIIMTLVWSPFVPKTAKFEFSYIFVFVLVHVI